MKRPVLSFPPTGLERHFRFACLAAVLWLWTTGVPAADQTGCDDLLQKADADYRAGNLRRALASVDACLEQGQPSREQRESAWALEAKIDLALDDLAGARRALEKLLASWPEYQVDRVRDSLRFGNLVAEMRRESTTVTVSSVSKTAESLREAPATVAVVTAQEIERRGYADLEALIHDLPGFDISRSHGASYSTLYQRGLRTDFTSRTLFLIDGVEQNDLQSRIAYISRQYPLSNVERVEVIYGPASTMYGANAFAGVINVITRKPGDAIADGERYGGKVYAAAGSFDTRYLDATVAGTSRSQTVSWSLTGRSFQSDEFDLSPFEDYDYDPAFFDLFSDEVYRRNLTEGGVVPTDAQVERARQLDRSGYEGERYSNPTDDWLVHGKLSMPNLDLAFQTWRLSEGRTPEFTDQAVPGGDSGFLFILDQLWFSVTYDRSLSRELSLNLFGRYKEHTLDGDTRFLQLRSYAQGERPACVRTKTCLGREDLLADTPSSFEGNFTFRSSNQLRAELGLVYDPSEKLSVVGGIEVRNSSVPGTLTASPDPLPSENESSRPLSDIAGDDRFNIRDLGIYAQASYRPLGSLKIVAGGRVDDNQFRETGGFGTVFTPRLAAIYGKGDWVFRGVYAEAFQDATLLQRFVTTPGRQELTSPDLPPEEVRNLEVGGSWQPRDDLWLDFVVYDSSYSNLVQLVEVRCPKEVCGGTEDSTTLQNLSTGSLESRGAQVTAYLKRGPFTFSGNYTYNDAGSSDATDGKGRPLSGGGELPVGDIASHQVNLSLNALLRDRLNLDLRLNYVGARETGPGTAFAASTGTAETAVSKPAGGAVDAYTVAHLTLSYLDLLPHTRLDLTVNNLFDEAYFHPGVRSADGAFFAALLPQPERSFLVRLSLSF